MPNARRRSRRAPLAVAAMFVAATTATTTAGFAGADDTETAYTVDHLTTGYWNGTAFAAGGATGVLEGMDTTLAAGINATFDFLALEDGTAPGSVVGTWSHSGNGFLTFDGVMQGQAVTGSGDLAFGGSQGSMTGDTRLIELRGDSRTTGTLTASAMGQSTSVPVDNVSPLPTLEVRVVGGTCDVVHGDWVYSIESEIAAQGLTANFSGRWTAWRDNTQDFEEELEALRAATDPDREGTFDELMLSGAPVLDDTAALMDEFEQFVASGDDDIEFLISLLRDAELTLMDLRAGSECERTFLGGLERFDTLLTTLIQEVIWYSVEWTDLTATQWQLLANTGARTGTLGRGAVNPGTAADVEAAMIRFAERELDAVIGDDGTLPSTDDVVRLTNTSAMLGWDLTIGGTTAPARQWWDELR